MEKSSLDFWIFVNKHIDNFNLRSGILYGVGQISQMLWCGYAVFANDLQLVTDDGDHWWNECKVDEPEPDCYYCFGLRGKRDAADVQRYLRSGIEL